MTDNELDRILNRWQAAQPSSGFRGRVLDNFPFSVRRTFKRPIRWALAIAAASGVLAIGMERNGHWSIEDLAAQVQGYPVRVMTWVGRAWVGHVLAGFRDSQLKIYVDGELRTDAEFGGGGEGWWVRVPGEGKYLLAMSRLMFEGPVPPRSGQFDGHVLEFQSGGRAVRIESDGTFGFGLEHLPVYVLGPLNR